VFGEPMTRPGGGMGCADNRDATSSRLVTASILVHFLREELELSLGLQEAFIKSSKVSWKFY
jgi:hypothetical protein